MREDEDGAILSHRRYGKRRQDYGSAVNAFPEKEVCMVGGKELLWSGRFLETGNFELSEEYKGVYEAKK